MSNIQYENKDKEVISYRKKQELFLAAKQKGLLWSYDKKIEYTPELDNLLIEIILKYGDIADLETLFLLYGERNFECLLPETANILQIFIENAPFLHKYVLVGGSACALHLCHRKSEDLDFFKTRRT